MVLETSKFHARVEIATPDCPGRRQWLYRQRYPGSYKALFVFSYIQLRNCFSSNPTEGRPRVLKGIQNVN